MSIRGVLVDWRGTLAATSDEEHWVAAALHRTSAQVFARLGFDGALAETLYAMEFDPLLDPFAAAGLRDLVHVFTLSFEQGVQKPDLRMFVRTLDALGIGPEEALMVGDRSGPDRGAVEVGIPTLLLPPLGGPDDRRLHHVLALCGARGHREPGVSVPGRWGGPAPR